jgi:hypothetical protein
MAKQWFIFKGGKQYGPMAPEQLKRTAASGELQPEDHVRPDDRQDWFKASSVKGLFTGEEATAGTDAAARVQEGHLVRNVAVAASAATALIAALILVPFAMRDTWELHNADRVSAKLGEADRLQQSDPTAALKMYDEALAEAKRHKITDQRLSRTLAVAEKSRGAVYQKVQKKIRADEAEAEKKRRAEDEVRRVAREEAEREEAEEKANSPLKKSLGMNIVLPS